MAIKTHPTNGTLTSFLRGDDAGVAHIREVVKDPTAIVWDFAAPVDQYEGRNGRPVGDGSRWEKATTPSAQTAARVATLHPRTGLPR